MQKDMHYYATFYLGCKAGLPADTVKQIAYSAQYVDDSTKDDSRIHPDRGLLYAIASAHHPLRCVVNAIVDRNEQRKVWVPFHFIPGGEGTALEERLVCLKDSLPARAMFENHLNHDVEYQNHLIGVAAHSYMDTFSHYGFSGISSDYNTVIEDSIECDVKDQSMKEYIIGKMGEFIKKFGLQSIARKIAEDATESLGHGGAMTLPDRPYLRWHLEFEKKHCRYEELTERDNRATFLEGCSELYKYLCSYADIKFGADSVSFASFEDEIRSIIAVEARKEDRIRLWKKAVGESIVDYDPMEWENAKKAFCGLDSSSDAAATDIYKFHQAVCYHRYYVLKELLPEYDIIVF